MPEQIPATQLVQGKWYVGRGRNGNVGLWDGTCFLVIAEKFDDFTIKHEPYYTDDWGCFQPFATVDEGVMAEPFGRVGWDQHYGRRVEFRGQSDPRNHPGFAESELVGDWLASAYRWDGTRIDCTLSLCPDGTFERRFRDQLPENGLEYADRGKWLHDREEHLLRLKPQHPDHEDPETSWCLLRFTGTALLVRWVTLESRNLPFLFYRISPTDHR